MSTPNNPGPRLPDKPITPPTIVGGTAAAAAPSDTTGVLARLKAAQPGATGTASDDDGAAGERRAPGTTGSTDSGPADQPVGPVPGGGAGDGAKRQSSDLGAGRGPRDVPSGPRPGADRSELLRLAADRANVAARATGRVVRRGSGATGRVVRRGSGATAQVVRRGSGATAQHVQSWNPDIVRQSVVTLCAVACILGSAAGVGAFGGPSIRDAAGGLFAPDATLLAPSSSAFAIWSVIYAGLVAYTAFQWLPFQRTSERQRRLGWTVAASMLLNLAWILSAQADRLALSLVVILLLLFALLAGVRTLNHYPSGSRLEGALVDTPIGLYLGWVLLAAAANAAAFLTDRTADLFGWHGTTWAVLGIMAVLVAAAVVCSTDRGRLSVAVATSWGLLWIAVERLLGEPFAVNVAFVAALAIFLLLITAGSRRHRVDHAQRRRLRAEEDAQREPLDLLGDYYEDSRY